MPSGFFYHTSLDRSISSKRGVWEAFIIICLTEIPVLNANNVDPTIKYQKRKPKPICSRCLTVLHHLGKQTFIRKFWALFVAYTDSICKNWTRWKG